MSPSIFLEKNHPPSNAELTRSLGDSQKHWDELRKHVQANHGPVAETWGYAGKAYGWSLGLKGKKRAVAYLIPGQAGFTCSMALSAAAVTEAGKRAFPPDVKQAIATAKNYPEGRAVRIEVQSSQDAAIAKELIDLKVSCS